MSANEITALGVAEDTLKDVLIMLNKEESQQKMAELIIATLAKIQQLKAKSK